MRSAVRILCCAAAVGALALSGCSVRDDHTAGAQEGDDTATLPTLPPAEERLPGSYDENGCLILSGGEVDCEASAEQLDEALAGGEVRTLAGFTGPLFTTDVSRDALVVLEDTVTVGTAENWTAQGLMRNETTSPAVAPVVQAVLRDGNGAELATVEGQVPVVPVRSGEPAPFTVTAEVPAAAVATVDWSVTDAGGAPPPGTRDLELTTYFVEPAGTRDPLDLYLYRETGTGPHPYVLFGSISDLADVAATDPVVVAGWLDADGHLRLVTEAPVGGPDTPLESVAGGTNADFLVTVEPGLADGLDGDDVLLWAVSR